MGEQAGGVSNAGNCYMKKDGTQPAQPTYAPPGSVTSFAAAFRYTATSSTVGLVEAVQRRL